MAWYHEFTIPFCKEGTRELDIEKTTIIVVLLIATIITFIIVREKYYERTSERKNHLRYALGITTGSHNNPRSSRKDIDYSFSYNKKIYYGSSSVIWTNFSIPIQGGRFYVEFSNMDPSNNEMLFDRPVPVDILNSPDTGWASIP